MMLGRVLGDPGTAAEDCCARPTWLDAMSCCCLVEVEVEVEVCQHVGGAHIDAGDASRSYPVRCDPSRASM